MRAIGKRLSKPCVLPKSCFTGHESCPEFTVENGWTLLYKYSGKIINF